MNASTDLYNVWGIISTPHSPENLILGIWFQDQQLKLKVLPMLMIQSKLCMSF